MKRYVVYEVFQHPTNSQDVGLEKIGQFLTEDSAKEFVNNMLHRNMIIEEEGEEHEERDEHEDMWNYPYAFMFPFLIGNNED